MVPALSSVIIGALMLLLAALATGWLLPAPWLGVLVFLLALGLVASAVIQALMGHRGRCWVERTLRWWLGPVGTLLDPFDAG